MSDSNHTFKQKMILLITEKGIIAIVIAVVGFLISQKLTSLEHQQTTQLKNLQHQHQKEIEALRADKNKQIALMNNAYQMERDSAAARLIISENEKEKNLRLFLQSSESQANKMLHELNISHDKSMKDLQFANDKVAAELGSRLDYVYGVSSDVTLKSIDYTASVYAKLADYKNASDELRPYLSGLINKNNNIKFNQRQVRYLFFNKVKKRIRKYDASRRALLTTIDANKFWLDTDEICKIDNYIKLTDSIIEIAGYSAVRFNGLLYIGPAKPNDESQQKNREQIDYLYKKRDVLETNVFLIKNKLLSKTNQ